MIEELDTTVDKIETIVTSQARRFHRKNKGVIPFEDLHDASKKGMHYALKSWDKTKATGSFEAFLVLWTRRRILNYIKKNLQKHAKQDEFIADSTSFNGSQQAMSIYNNREKPYVTKNKKEYFNWLLNTANIPDRYREVIKMRYSGMTLQAIADDSGISNSRVSQMCRVSLERMKEVHKAEQERIGA